MTGITDSRSAEVLLVDDNPDDVFLTMRAFEVGHFAVNVHHVNDGAKCMAFLRKQAPFEGAPTPDIVLLDLNMPVMDGREVLAEIVRDPQLRHLAVIVLTTSTADSDVLQMYRLRCSAYVAKPVGFENFARAVTKLGNFWLKLVVMPAVAAPEEPRQGENGPIGRVT